MEPFAATAAILAGGRSSRMGQDKSLLPLGGRPLIQTMAAQLQSWFREVLVVTNDPSRYAFLGLPMVGDRLVGAGPLAGMEAALTAAGRPLVHVLACDMPFIDRAVVAHLLARAQGGDAAVPQRQGEWEPLYAVYHRRCLPAITAALERGERRMISFFAGVRVVPVPEAELAPLADLERLFFNMNTPADWAAAQRMVGQDH